MMMSMLEVAVHHMVALWLCYGCQTCPALTQLLPSLQDSIIYWLQHAGCAGPSRHCPHRTPPLPLQDSIMRMFEEAGCSTPAVQEMLGDAGITEVNMLQYLGILEQRTNEILQVGATTVVHDFAHLQQRTSPGCLTNDQPGRPAV